MVAWYCVLLVVIYFAHSDGVSLKTLPAEEGKGDPPHKRHSPRYNGIQANLWLSVSCTPRMVLMGPGLPRELLVGRMERERESEEDKLRKVR